MQITINLYYLLVPSFQKLIPTKKRDDFILSFRKQNDQKSRGQNNFLNIIDPNFKIDIRIKCRFEMNTKFLMFGPFLFDINCISTLLFYIGQSRYTSFCYRLLSI